MPVIALDEAHPLTLSAPPLRQADTVLGEGLRYWTSLSDGVVAPARADFDPMAIPKVLPHVLFTRVETPSSLDGLVEGEFLVIGEFVREKLKTNYRHRRFSDVLADPLKAEIRTAYQVAAQTLRPVFLEQNYVGPAERIGGTREIFLPFRGKGPGHAFVLTIVQFLTSVQARDAE